MLSTALSILPSTDVARLARIVYCGFKKVVQGAVESFSRQSWARPGSLVGQAQCSEGFKRKISTSKFFNKRPGLVVYRQSLLQLQGQPASSQPSSLPQKPEKSSYCAETLDPGRWNARRAAQALRVSRPDRCLQSRLLSRECFSDRAPSTSLQTPCSREEERKTSHRSQHPLWALQAQNQLLIVLSCPKLRAMDFLISCLHPLLSQLFNTVFFLGLSLGWKLRGACLSKVAHPADLMKSSMSSAATMRHMPELIVSAAACANGKNSLLPLLKLCTL